VLAGLRQQHCPEIYIANRTPGRAEELAEWFGEPVQAIGWDERHQLMSMMNLVVNATSQGMKGQPALDINLSALPTGAFVNDLIYHPLETPLLQQAKKLGLHVADGLGMLLYQAVPAFAAWFGQTPTITPELRCLMAEGL
ncbi:MAG: shikimate dehydrogenase, partial [Alphaproteobacteria bacterium]|nr:shikimate dehydrogenase [Alphaproteobacteria bacterium]